MAAAVLMKQDAPPVLGLITAAVLSSALHVDKALDAKLPCPANAALEQAIKVRLPQVKLGKGDLRARITATEGGFRLELQRADGSAAMSRDLYSGCAQLGDMSALIIERFLTPSPLVGEKAGVRGPVSEPRKEKPLDPVDAGMTEISQTVDAGSSDALELIARIGATPSPEPPAEEPPLTPTKGEAEPVINLPPPSPPQPIVTGIEVSLAGGLWYGDPRVMGAFSLDVGVMLRDRVRLAVLALANTPITRRIEDGAAVRGSVESFDLGAFAMLGVCTRTMLQLCGNAFGGARITWAAASTSPEQKARLFRTGTGVISVPELGLLARAQYLLLGRIILALELIGGLPLIRGEIAVEGFEPLRSPPFDLLGLLRVGVRL